jgi:Ni/Co efflux regulator RcnB
MIAESPKIKGAAMLRVTTIVALVALALPTMALAQPAGAEHGKGKGAPRAPVHQAQPVPHAAIHQHAPVVHGPVGHGPVVHGPVGHGPVVHGPVVHGHGPAVVLGHGGPHGPFVFHGHPFAWHPVHFPHPWVYPQGYGYRLWTVGAVLPPMFWQRPDYYYTGWAEMGLPPPDPGFQYVEYGPDLLLVNVSTGEVVQVFPGAFG